MLILLTVGTGVLWSQTNEAAARFQHAMELQQTQDWVGAAAAYRDFLITNPNEVGAHANLGVVLAKLGRYDEAIAEYDKAETLDPNDPRIELNIALAYSKSGRLSQAKEKLDPLHVTNPQDNQVTLLLADTCLQLGQYQDVINLLKPLDDGGNMAVTYMLGTAFMRSKRIDEGQVVLNRILSRGDSAEARFLLGTSMFESGDYPAAVKQLASAAELNPNLPELQSFYGQALLFTGDPDGASQAFEKALASNGNDYRANLGLGEILAQRKRYKESLPVLERAALLRPQSPEALEFLGHVLLGLNQVQEARLKLEASKQGGGSSRQLHEDLGQVYARLGLSAEAARENKASVQAQITPPGESGPRLNDLAPDFSLASLNGDKKVSLNDFKGKTPVVLVFGSYSCPNLRASSAVLENLYSRYGQRVPFLFVYIREAHTGQSWESTRNVREGVAVSGAVTLAQKQEHAAMCSRKLHLDFPAAVDGLDGAVETAYAAWPSRAVILGMDGRLVYSTRLTELDFRADEMESYLKRVSVSVRSR